MDVYLLRHKLQVLHGSTAGPLKATKPSSDHQQAFDQMIAIALLPHCIRGSIDDEVSEYMTLYFCLFQRLNFKHDNEDDISMGWKHSGSQASDETAPGRHDTIHGIMNGFKDFLKPNDDSVARNAIKDSGSNANTHEVHSGVVACLQSCQVSVATAPETRDTMHGITHDIMDFSMIKDDFSASLSAKARGSSVDTGPLIHYISYCVCYCVVLCLHLSQCLMHHCLSYQCINNTDSYDVYSSCSQSQSDIYRCKILRDSLLQSDYNVDYAFIKYILVVPAWYSMASSSSMVSANGHIRWYLNASITASNYFLFPEIAYLRYFNLHLRGVLHVSFQKQLQHSKSHNFS